MGDNPLLKARPPADRLSPMHKMEKIAYNIAGKKFASYLLYRRKVRNRNFCYGDFHGKNAGGILEYLFKKVPASSIASI